MSSEKDHLIDEMDKDGRRQEYLDMHPKLKENGCKYSMLGKCASGSNPKDGCDYEYEQDKCPYRD